MTDQPFETEPIKLVYVKIYAAGKNYEVTISELEWTLFIERSKKEPSDRIVHLSKGYYYKILIKENNKWRPVLFNSALLFSTSPDKQFSYYELCPKSGYGIRHSDIELLSYEHFTAQVKKETTNETQNDL